MVNNSHRVGHPGTADRAVPGWVPSGLSEGASTPVQVVSAETTACAVSRTANGTKTARPWKNTTARDRLLT